MKTMSSSTQRSRKFREKLKKDRKDRERKTKQAQGRVSLSEKEKAGTKVKTSLPQSPSKMPHVIAKVVGDMSPGKRGVILEVCDNSVKRRKLEEANRKRRSDALSDDEVKEIEVFYLRDDISRMCPGRKDVSVKTPTRREQKQKRLLLLIISEAHEIFKQESKAEVGLSKFASLRPRQVIPVSSCDHEVCMCKYHENIGLLLVGLHSVLSGVPKSPEVLLNTTVCNLHDQTCTDRECSVCEVEKPVEELFKGCDESLPVL